MMGWKDIRLARLHYKELRKEIENYRLIEAAEKTGRVRKRVYLSGLLLWIARRLIDWGSFLETRYDNSRMHPV
jgi:hypothetical protein